MFNNLPDFCYASLPITGKIIVIKKGESGYYPTDIVDSSVDDLNLYLGVTQGQREAMEVGSMFGWDVPGANPDIYDENGVIVKGKLNKGI